MGSDVPQIAGSSRRDTQEINAQEFARRLSTLVADALTSDDVVDLARSLRYGPQRRSRPSRTAGDTQRLWL